MEKFWQTTNKGILLKVKQIIDVLYKQCPFSFKNLMAELENKYDCTKTASWLIF